MAADVPAPTTDTKAAALRLARGFAPAVLTLVAALYSIFVLCDAGAATATPEQWARVATQVREARVSTELIVFAPAWADPVGRQYLGDQMSIDMAARMDAARYTGIWEVGVQGARAPETRGLKALSSTQVGPLTVRHYRQEPVTVRYDFTAQWREGQASGEMQGRPNSSLEEVGFEPHRCVKVVPRPDGTVVMRFDAVPLGSRIEGYVGLADIFTRRDIRSPGRLAVLVNDKLEATVTAGIDDGWKRFSVPTKPGHATVEFRLTAPGVGARDRRICFAAEARE